MNRLLLVLVAALVAGCASRKPSIERDPAGYAPAESDSRKVTRLEERLHASRDRINGWTRELELGRGHGTDEARVDAATERLRACRRDLERVRMHANDVGPRAADSEDLERQAIEIEAAAGRAHRDGLDALGRREGAPERP